MRYLRIPLALLMICLAFGCERRIGEEDAGPGPRDTGPGLRDAGPPMVDAGPGPVDAGPRPTDAGPDDAGATDAGATDAGATDAGATDAGTTDAGSVDGGASDAGAADAGLADAGTSAEVFYPLDDTDFTDDTGASIESLEGPSMTLTVDGIAMTLAANDGDLNQTSSGFGINHSGSGDDTDGVDGVAGVEVLTVTFAVDVTLLEVDLSSLSGDDEGAIAIHGGAPISFTSSGVTSLGGAPLLSGQTLTFSHVAGNGFQLDSIRISVP